MLPLPHVCMVGSYQGRCGLICSPESCGLCSSVLMPASPCRSDTTRGMVQRFMALPLLAFVDLSWAVGAGIAPEAGE